MAKRRLFFGLGIPEIVRNQIDQSVQKLRKNFDLRWVKKENLHITICFLGSVEEEKIPVLCELLESSLKTFPLFSCKLSKLGAFPSFRKCSVLWLGLVQGSLECQELKKKVDEALILAGFGREHEEFIPHLTLARAKSRPSKLDAAQNTFFEEPIDCGEITHLSLFSSDLSAGAPRYQELYKIVFKKN